MSVSMLTFFAIAFIIVFMMRVAKMGTLLAFLFTGILVGEHVFGLFHLSDTWNFLGDLGIMFLWFNIGLQINMKRLWQLKRTIFGFGAAQVLMVAVMLFPILFNITNWTMLGTVMIALIFAMSSTSEDLQILIDRNQLQTSMGRQTFSILLFQDLLSIPLLAMLPILTGKSFNLGASIIDILILSVGLILAVIIMAKVIINPLIKFVARVNSKEAFILVIMLNIIVWTVVFNLIGLPSALGAFLAGMLMSETIYRHQITATIEPYSTLFLSLFFIVLGMGLNVHLLGQHWLAVMLGVIGLIGIKFIALYIVARVRRVGAKDATLMSIILAQGGEFGLLILQTMKINGINAIPEQHREIMMAIIIISIMLTPVFLLLYDHLVKAGKLFAVVPNKKLSDPIQDISPDIIICGFGRVGQIIAQILDVKKIPYVAIDTNIDEVMVSRENGYNVVYGDSSDVNILKSVGLLPRKTKCVVIAMKDSSSVHKTIDTIKTVTPKMKIFARAYNLIDAKQLLADGVKKAMPETIESSFLLGATVLQNIGIKQVEINTILEDLRSDDYAKIHKTIEI